MSKHYKSSNYQLISLIHEKHFWFDARKDLISKVITKFIGKIAGQNFLEVGFGTGVVLRQLDKMGFRTFGIDVNAQAIDYAKKQTRAKLFKSSLSQYKPPKNINFAAIGAFDVLEHQNSDDKFLAQCFRILKPGSFLFLTVPAGMWLWTKSDVEAGHKRRYAIQDLTAKLKQAGFSIIFINYWNFTTLPFYYIHKLIVSLTNSTNSKALGSFLTLPHPIFSTFLYYLLKLEMKFIFLVRLPAGSSIVVAAVKNRIKTPLKKV
jgi:SAM-dependent methyltransferase